MNLEAIKLISKNKILTLGVSVYTGSFVLNFLFLEKLDPQNINAIIYGI